MSMSTAEVSNLGWRWWTAGKWPWSLALSANTFLFRSPNQTNVCNLLTIWTDPLQGLSYMSEVQFDAELFSTSVYKGVPRKELDEAWRKLVERTCLFCAAESHFEDHTCHLFIGSLLSRPNDSGWLHNAASIRRDNEVNKGHWWSLLCNSWGFPSPPLLGHHPKVHLAEQLHTRWYFPKSARGSMGTCRWVRLDLV